MRSGNVAGRWLRTLSRRAVVVRYDAKKGKIFSLHYSKGWVPWVGSLRDRETLSSGCQGMLPVDVYGFHKL